MSNCFSKVIVLMFSFSHEDKVSAHFYHCSDLEFRFDQGRICIVFVIVLALP